MIGGAIPPGQRWIDSLPILDPDNPTAGIGIYTGSIGSVTNAVFSLEWSEEAQKWLLGVYLDMDGIGHWRFDTINGFEVTSEATSISWRDAVINGLGMTEITIPADPERVEEFQRDQISFKGIEV